jgi:hypothetical protein
MDDLKKLKLKVFEVAVMYFGAAGRGPKFMEKIEEVFDAAEQGMKKGEDHGGRVEDFTAGTG